MSGEALTDDRLVEVLQRYLTILQALPRGREQAAGVVVQIGKPLHLWAATRRSPSTTHAPGVKALAGELLAHRRRRLPPAEEETVNR